MIPSTTLLAFRDAVDEGRAILITDNETGDAVHHAPCSGVREEYFTEKVIVKGGRNGSYFEFEDSEPAPLLSCPCGLNRAQQARRAT
jgi:hypothetical protein